MLALLLADSARATSYTLTVTTVGAGTITTNPTFASYPANVTVTLTATPSNGWYFGGWSGAGGGTTNTLNVAMTNNRSVTGTFLAYPVYTLTLTTNGQGSIGVSPAGTSFSSNSVVTATATPAAGWVFAGWSGATNSLVTPLSFALNTNQALTGNFAQLPAFDVQPQGQTNLVGSTVTFSAHSVGAAPVAYQWYFGSNPLTGAASPTLSLTNTTPGQAGFYQVVATNLYGTSTSAVVALVLNNSTGPTNVVSVCDEASLQTAIRAGGWISIGCSGTITLTNTLAITNHVILDASGVYATLDGGNLVRLFYVAPGASLAVSNLTLANGNVTVTNNTPLADGGAIYNNGGSLNLTACTLAGNSVFNSYYSGSNAADGGAIYNQGGTLTLTGCMVTNNRASANCYYGGIGRGGAIFNNGGTVGLYGTTLVSNTVYGANYQAAGAYGVAGAGFGGALYNTNGTMTMANCLVGNNACSNDAGPGVGACKGGALFQASGVLILSNTSFASNQARGGVIPNIAEGPTPVLGGALAALGGSVTMDHCQWWGNIAQGGDNLSHAAAGNSLGGAIYGTAAIAAFHCTISGNAALAGNRAYGPSFAAATGYGGGIYNAGTLTLDDCVVSSNLACGGTAVVPFSFANGGNSFGGGIFNADRLLATNCTIALNSALGASGSSGSANTSIAANGSALGGGVYNSAAATFQALNVTIASNWCNAQPANPGPYYTNGLAAGLQIANTNGSVSVRNSLLAYGGTNGNTYGAITDLGDNISSDGSASFNSGTSYNFTDPLLGPLANNGGPTLTMALLPGSPAIQYADSATAPPDDQRGFARPAGVGVIDLGAYQSGASQIYTPPPTISLSIVRAFPNFRVSFTTLPLITNTLHLQSSTNLNSWTDLATFGAYSSPSNIVQTINPLGTRQQFFRLWW